MNFDFDRPARYATVQPLLQARSAATSNTRLRFRFYLALLILDMAALAIAFPIANLAWLEPPFSAAGINVLVTLLPLYVAIAASRDVYSAVIFETWRHAAGRSLAALAAAALAVLFVSFYLHASATMSRAVFSIGTIVAGFGIVSLRFAAHRLGRRVFGGYPIAVVLIADGVACADEPGVAVVDARAIGLVPDIADPRALDRLGRLLMPADRVVVACEEDRRPAWAAALKGASVRGEIVAPELAALGSLGAGEFAGRPTLAVSVGPLDLRSRAFKRGLDLALSSAMLLFLAPLLLSVALAVRLDSPGPVLFVQPRSGRGNRLFAMYKFRSMRSELCDTAGNASTARGDSRITRVGRLIRATSIDELPQILNVLRGDMSIVGPRPHALGSLAGTKLFWEVDQRYWHRHAAKPGITGLAQVRGFRGATHEQADLVDRLQADLEYLNGWTIWRDLSILFATFRVVLHRNAY